MDYTYFINFLILQFFEVNHAIVVCHLTEGSHFGGVRTCGGLLVTAPHSDDILSKHAHGWVVTLYKLTPLKGKLGVWLMMYLVIN